MKREHQGTVVPGRHAAAWRRWEEKCLCGHGRAEHALWLEIGGGLVAVEVGGGTCQCGACLCERFRPAFLACRTDG
jgi:hypothetical protein